jgi:hypothetical protein
MWIATTNFQTAASHSFCTRQDQLLREQLQLSELSEKLRRDPIALRQRIVYFARRIVTRERSHAAEGDSREL